MSETIPSYVIRDKRRSSVPTLAEVFGKPKSVGSDETSPTTHEDIIDADIVEETRERCRASG